jgi:ATP-dependent DNA ligase
MELDGRDLSLAPLVERRRALNWLVPSHGPGWRSTLAATPKVGRLQGGLS